MKTITSPVKRFPGTVEMPDFFTWLQLAEWQDKTDLVKEDTPRAEAVRYQAAAVTCMGLIWHIEGLPECPTAENLLGLPAISAMKLATWLFTEIGRVIDEEEEIPNA